MGTIYYVGCRDCNVYRDLDKFYALRPGVNSRAKALSLCEEIKGSQSFRAALLVSFMADHLGHNCTTFSEHNADVCEEFDPDYTWENKESKRFWEENWDGKEKTFPNEV